MLCNFRNQIIILHLYFKNIKLLNLESCED